MSDKLDALKAEYEQKKSLYESFCEEIEGQLSELMCQEGITLVVPIEYRVKSWESIAENCNRNNLTPDALAEIGDIAGLRIVLLFRRDREKACGIIINKFEVLKEEDTQNRLSVDQFGYGSVHFEVRPMQEWFSLPTLSRLRGLQAEIQVRTGSQHIWAAAAHALQYKRESHVPMPLRRAINRAAALLEMVDLEFERVLVEREAYVAQLDKLKGDEPLNTDILQKILADEFPSKNADETTEDLSDLLDDLITFNITNVTALRELIKKHREAIFGAEEKALKAKVGYTPKPERLAKGVFFTHVGLARQALRQEFGEKFAAHLISRQQRRALQGSKS
jgi:putative GTP pyrophosphokinase